MKKLISLILASVFLAGPAFAQEAAKVTGDAAGWVGLATGIAMGLAALGCGLGQGKAVSAALESIGRNPSAAGNLQTPMILGLVFIETLVILTFVTAIFLLGKI